MSGGRAPGTCSWSTQAASVPYSSSWPTSGPIISASSRAPSRTRPMSEDGSFETTVDLNAPVQEVFRHLTDPVAMVRWMGQHATLEPAPGGAFEVDINGVPVRGCYLEVDPPR